MKTTLASRLAESAQLLARRDPQAAEMVWGAAKRLQAKERQDEVGRALDEDADGYHERTLD